MTTNFALPLTTIHVEQRPDGFIAFAGDRATLGTGLTPYDAIGDLVVGFGLDLGLDVEIPAVDCPVCGNSGRRDGKACPRCHGFGRFPHEPGRPAKGQSR